MTPEEEATREEAKRLSSIYNINIYIVLTMMGIELLDQYEVQQLSDTHRIIEVIKENEV